jgi:PhoPQ-activated pathogenicity-related protein
LTITWKPFSDQGVLSYSGTPQFYELTKIIDPLNYFSEDMYKQQLANIPIYVVNASSDGFYAPDNSQLYMNTLNTVSGGQSALLTMPNTGPGRLGFLTARKLLIDIKVFLVRINSGQPMPHINESYTSSDVLSVDVSQQLDDIKSAKLYMAVNDRGDRDFRLDCSKAGDNVSLAYQPQDITSEIKDQNGKFTKRRVPSSWDGKWRAYFIKFTYQDGLEATTSTYVAPSNQYPDHPPYAHGDKCATFQTM